MTRSDALYLLKLYARRVCPRAGIDDPVLSGIYDRFPTDGSEAKAMRWLGFMQGALYARGVFTLDEVKDHSRMLAHNERAELERTLCS